MRVIRRHGSGRQQLARVAAGLEHESQCRGEPRRAPLKSMPGYNGR